jgi:hypothetical protein
MYQKEKPQTETMGGHLMAWNDPGWSEGSIDYLVNKLYGRVIQRMVEQDALIAQYRLAEAVTRLRMASLAAGAADLALTAGLPVAVWVGVFVALGAPYAQAQALVRKTRISNPVFRRVS